MRRVAGHVSRIVLCVGTILLLEYSPELWWIMGVPWIVMTIFGILATIPLLMVIGMIAGGAQADWMSDAFVIVLLLIAPTVMATVISEVYSLFRLRCDASAKGQSDLASEGAIP